MNILVAPDSFKGTYSAAEVAEAISSGILDAGGVATPLPVADGGEGTFDALCYSLDAMTVAVDAQNAWGEPITASIGMARGSGVAVVEVAQASGLMAARVNVHDAISASTYGTGILIAAALSMGASHVMVAAGGSATTDGGEGAVRALKDAGGLGRARITVLSDVTTTFLDAPRVFGPQKGADAPTISFLEARLSRLTTEYPRNPTGVPRTGAAGGLAGGLWANFDAELVCGADAVLDAVMFEEVLRTTDAVIVGEGRLDSQTGEGKIISAILDRIRKADRAIPVIAVVGSVAADLGSYIHNFSEVIVASDTSAMYKAGQSLARYSVSRS